MAQIHTGNSCVTLGIKPKSWDLGTILCSVLSLSISRLTFQRNKHLQSSSSGIILSTLKSNNYKKKKPKNQQRCIRDYRYVSNKGISCIPNVSIDVYRDLSIYKHTDGYVRKHTHTYICVKRTER